MQNAKWLVVAAALAGAACSTAGKRDVTGELASGASALSIVVAQSADGRVFASSVTTQGGFRLSLPAGQRYRLSVATQTPGGFILTSPIFFSSATGAHRWALIDSGPVLRLGTIRLDGTASGGGVSSESDDNDPSDDVSDGDTCESGDHDGDHDGGNDGDGSGGMCSSQSSGDDGSGGGDDGDHHGMCDGGTSQSAPTSSLATGADVESGGDVHCDDGHPGDDDGDHLQCGADGGAVPDAGTVGDGGIQ